jgi:hypothetical protein
MWFGKAMPVNPDVSHFAAPKLREALYTWTQSALNILSARPPRLRAVRYAVAETHESSRSLNTFERMELDAQRTLIGAFDDLLGLTATSVVHSTVVEDIALADIVVDWVFGSTRSLPGFSVDPTSVLSKFHVFSHILHPFVMEYWTSSGSLDFDEDKFGRAYALLEQSLFEPDSVILQFVQHFWNLKVETSPVVIAPNLYLRNATAEEWDSAVTQSGPYETSGGFEGNLWNEHSLGAVFEMTGRAGDFPRGGEHSFTGQARTAAAAIELGLRLFQQEWVKAKWAESRSISPFPPGKGGTVFGASVGTTVATPLPAQVFFAAPCLVDSALAESLVTKWELLLAAVTSPDLEVPLIRYSDSFERLRSHDTLIDYWIALEAMFLHGDPRGDMSEKAALAISNFLGQSSQERVDLRAAVINSYKWRSKVVHGDNGPDRQALNRVTRQTRAILSRCLIKRIHELCPVSPATP